MVHFRLTDLVYGPRLQPAWLSLVTSQQGLLQKQADSLVSDMCSVLAIADTKHTNLWVFLFKTDIYFVSHKFHFAVLTDWLAIHLGVVKFIVKHSFSFFEEWMFLSGSVIAKICVNKLA